MQVLVIEDEKAMAELLRDALIEQGCAVKLASTGDDGLRLATEFPFEVIVLDVMLPGMDGFEVSKTLRRLNISTPILFLTARDTLSDIVYGLNNGGDDYLTKPFSFAVLLARLHALARRRPEIHPEMLKVGNLTLDLTTREVLGGNAPIRLTRTEYLLLEFLMKNARRVVTRQMLTDAAWGFSTNVESNTLDVFMRHLRVKLEGSGSDRLLQTVRGVGYRLRASERE